jgi:hypothetical protein
VRRRPPLNQSEPGTPLPLRATGIVLALWVAAMIFLALVVVPLLFSTCLPTPPS